MLSHIHAAADDLSVIFKKISNLFGMSGSFSSSHIAEYSKEDVLHDNVHVIEQNIPLP